MAVASIGRESFVGGGGEAEAEVVIGSFTSVAGHVQMLARPQHACIADPHLVACGSARIPDWPASTRETAITIGSDVWIGRNAVLLAPVTIGHGAIVGAFAVVAKDVPPYAVVVGNPAQVIRYRFDPQTVAQLLTVAWWDWPDAVIAERAAALRDVRALVARYAYDVDSPPGG
jgi:acetyltransferase-like isoleucine patch superfamily enzyme